MGIVNCMKSQHGARFLRPVMKRDDEGDVVYYDGSKSTNCFSEWREMSDAEVRLKIFIGLRYYKYTYFPLSSILNEDCRNIRDDSFSFGNMHNTYPRGMGNLHNDDISSIGDDDDKSFKGIIESLLSPRTYTKVPENGVEMKGHNSKVPPGLTTMYRERRNNLLRNTGRKKTDREKSNKWIRDSIIKFLKLRSGFQDIVLL